MRKFIVNSLSKTEWSASGCGCCMEECEVCVSRGAVQESKGVRERDSDRERGVLQCAQRYRELCLHERECAGVLSAARTSERGVREQRTRGMRGECEKKAKKCTIHVPSATAS